MPDRDAPPQHRLHQLRRLSAWNRIIHRLSELAVRPDPVVPELLQQQYNRIESLLTELQGQSSSNESAGHHAAPASTPSPPPISPVAIQSTEQASTRDAMERLEIGYLSALLEHPTPSVISDLRELCAIIEGVAALRARPPFDTEWSKSAVLLDCIGCTSRIFYEGVYGGWGQLREDAVTLIAKQLRDCLLKHWRIDAYRIEIVSRDETFESARHEWDRGRPEGPRVKPLAFLVFDKSSDRVARRAIVCAASR